MNVRGMANAATSGVNPNIPATLILAQDYLTDASGKRVPVQKFIPVRVQVQGVGARELAHLDGLNIQGVMRSVYVSGDVEGVARIDRKGGDQLRFAEVPAGTPQTWKVVQVQETWPNWCRVIVVLQS
ncbi:MAG: hypothetical protein KGH75_02685 [Rhodospirillales bacterium]|nr:hypothetical protein [Rhodospirillales bacterium]